MLAVCYVDGKPLSITMYYVLRLIRGGIVKHRPLVWSSRRKRRQFVHFVKRSIFADKKTIAIIEIRECCAREEDER